MKKLLVLLFIVSLSYGCPKEKKNVDHEGQRSRSNAAQEDLDRQ